MVPWSSPGDILRWWRHDVLQLSQQQVADRLSVKPTALSNWENGARAISIDIDQIDRALDGGGVLGGLLWSFGTPNGLDPDQLWTKVFPGESTPVWMWIRSESREITITAEWGIARFERQLELPPNGLFATVPMSVANAPVVVHVSEPSWVDFGRGELPTEVPGAEVNAAISYAKRSAGNGTFYELFFGNLGDRFSRSRSRQLAKLHRSAPWSLASFFKAFGRSEVDRPPQAPWPPLPTEPDPDDRLRYARLRRARHLSLVDAANRLAAMSGIEVSKDTLRRFETDIGQPHDRLLPAALDQMLGADGHLAVVELRADEGSGAVRVPHYWYGPMWFEFTGPDREVVVNIQWGDWSRDVKAEPPMRLAYHHSEGGLPLRITADPDVSWKVGIGRRPAASPINYGWTPASVDVVQRAITETEDVILTSLEQTAQEQRARDLDE